MKFVNGDAYDGVFYKHKRHGEGRLKRYEEYVRHCDINQLPAQIKSSSRSHNIYLSKSHI